MRGILEIASLKKDNFSQSVQFQILMLENITIVQQDRRSIMQVLIKNHEDIHKRRPLKSNFRYKFHKFSIIYIYREREIDRYMNAQIH